MYKDIADEVREASSINMHSDQNRASNFKNSTLKANGSDRNIKYM